MDKDKINCELVITDYDCPAKEITDLLKIEPSEVINIGDVRRVDPSGNNPPVLHKTNFWSLKSGLNHSASIEDHIDALLAKLSDAEEAITEMSDKYTITLSVYGDTYQGHFGLNLVREQIQKIARMGITFDVDIYCMD
jgi:hypothetical protein